MAEGMPDSDSERLADLERARKLYFSATHDYRLSGPMPRDQWVKDCIAAFADVRDEEQKRQILRVAKLRMRDSDRALPRNLVEEIAAAFPVDDWSDILANALRTTEPEQRNGITRVIASAHAAFTAQEVAAVRAEAMRRERERCIKAVQDEPELPGEPPYDVLIMLRSDPAEVMRIVCRLTKRGVAARIRALSDQPQSNAENEW